METRLNRFFRVCFFSLFLSAFTALADSYQIAVPPNLSLIANHLDNGGNTLDEVLPNVINGTEIQKYNCDGTYTTYTKGAGGWSPPTGTLKPGEGAFINNKTPNPFNVTFTGTPHAPVLPPPLPCGCGVDNLVSAQTTNNPPTFADIMGFPPANNTILRRYTNSTGTFVNYTFHSISGAWTPPFPAVNPGESVFVKLPSCTTTPSFNCLSNKTVDGCSSWSFDQPTNIVVPCYTNYPLTFNDVTNSGPCPLVITRTWMIKDVCGNSSTCNQTLTVSCCSNCCVNCSEPYPLCYTNSLVQGQTYFLANNLCQGTHNTLGEMFPFPNVPDNTVLRKWNPATQTLGPVYTMDTANFGGWIDENFDDASGVRMAPGEGFAIVSRDSSFDLVICGCNPVCPLPCLPPTNGCVLVGRYGIGEAGWSDLSSCVPVCGTRVSIFNGAGFDNYDYYNNTWNPPLPPLGIGESAFVCLVANTNCQSCTNPITMTCFGNKTVPCGSNWTFDTPTNIVDPCCTNYSIAFSDTNSSSTCPLVTTRTWVISDPCGNTNTCSQTVTVVNSNTACSPLLARAGLTNITVWEQSSGITAYRFPVGSPALLATNGPVPGTNDIQISGTLEYYDVYVSDPEGRLDTNGCCLTIVCNYAGSGANSSSGGNIDAVELNFSSGVSIGASSVGKVQPGTLTDPALIASSGNAIDALGSHDSKSTRLGRGVSRITLCFPQDCNSSKTVQCGTIWSFDPPPATNSCCGSNVTVSNLNTITNGTGCSTVITRTWEITDCCSNKTTCSQTVTVVDTTPPVINSTTCATNQTALGGINDDFAGPEPTSPSPGLVGRVQALGKTCVNRAFDDCGVNCDFIHTFSNLPPCITEATLCTRVKPCGNVSNGTQNDTIELSFTGPTGALFPGSGFWARFIGLTNGQAGVFTNDWNPSVVTNGLMVCLDLSALPLAGGGTTNLLPYLSQYGFLDFRCEDDTAVDFLVLNIKACCCATNKTVQCGTSWAFDKPTATDNCSGTNLTFASTDLTNGSCPQRITRTWRVSDLCGNTNTCNQTITVVTPPPTVICPPDRTITANTQCLATIPDMRSDLLVSNSCGLPAISQSPIGTTNGVGTYPVIFTVLDVCSNIVKCTNFVTITCPPLFTNTPPGDDFSTLVPLCFSNSICFCGHPYTSLYINNNGNITFGGAYNSYTPGPLGNVGLPIIAPFWADVDTRAGGGTVGYSCTSYQGRPAMIIRWDNVGYYSQHTDRRNSFQVMLVDRAAGDFDILFHYDKIQWDTGDASGGKSARAGLACGPQVSFELGSGTSGAFLDSNPTTGLIHNGLNGPPGDYYFYVSNCVVLTNPPVANRPPTANAGANQSVCSKGSNCCATVQLDGSLSSDPDGDGLTYSWTENNVPIANGKTPTLSLCGLGSHTIQLAVSDGHNPPVYSSVSINLHDCAPINDECTNAVSLVVGSVCGTTICATTSPVGSIPVPCCNSASSPDVWYTFTPQCDGQITIDTCGTCTNNPTFDTVLHVYTGGCGTLTLVPNASNNDATNKACGHQSRVIYDGKAGVTYYIRVAGFNGASGPFRLNVGLVTSAPINDLCTNATLVTSGTYGFNNCGANTDGPVNPTNCITFNDIWFRFTAPCGGLVSIDTCNSSFDTVVSIYANTCGNLALVTCNDNTTNKCAGTASFVTFTASAGTTYTIRVGSAPGAATGAGILTIQGPFPPYPTCPPVSGLAYTRAFLLSGSPSGTPWSWSIGVPCCANFGTNVEGVANTEPLLTLAQKFAKNIEDNCGSAGVTAKASEDSGQVKLQVSVTYCEGVPIVPFIFRVGAAGASQQDQCVVPKSPGLTDPLPTTGPCSFNPDIVDLPLAGQDLNNNGVDDAIDIMTGANADVNGNGILDETELCLPPDFSIKAYSQAVTLGSSVSLTVAVTGTGPFSYKWSMAGALLADSPNISGALSNTLTIQSVTTTNLGDYTVTVSNACGTISSIPATLSTTSVVAPILMNVKLLKGTFQFAFDTKSGQTYYVEYKNQLNSGAWNLFETVTGDGQQHTSGDAGPLPATRFYRVRTTSP